LYFIIVEENSMTESAIATLGGGCFWCLEAVFLLLKGVSKAESGYSGGSTENPTYKQVCSGTTNHAEVVQITFDPNVIRFADLLRVFFTIHDPTTLNRQGADVGTQYRSIILYHNEEQKRIAEEVIQEITKEGLYSNPLVTELKPFKIFYKAEDYHQNYFNTNPQQPYCKAVVAPKVAKARKAFLDKLKQ
jgi:peptide-methionine (S)-S-oxide reductase